MIIQACMADVFSFCFLQVLFFPSILSWISQINSVQFRSFAWPVRNMNMTLKPYSCMQHVLVHCEAPVKISLNLRQGASWSFKHVFFSACKKLCQNCNLAFVLWRVTTHLHLVVNPLSALAYFPFDLWHICAYISDVFTTWWSLLVCQIGCIC